MSQRLTDLSYACTEGDCVRIYEILEAHKDVQDKHKELIWASRRGQYKVVEMLLKAGADVHFNNDAALAWASSRGHVDIMKLLLEYGANIHTENDWCIRGASAYGQPLAVKLLLEYGADVHADNNYSVNRASSLIDSDGIYEIVELLLDYGADKERLHPTATPEMREYIPVNPRRVWGCR